MGKTKLLWYGAGAVALYLLLRPSTSGLPTGAVGGAPSNTGLLGALTNGVNQTTTLLRGIFGTPVNSPPSTQTPAPTDANLNSYPSSSGFASVPGFSSGDGTDAVDA